jgi:hypothetical protein
MLKYVADKLIEETGIKPVLHCLAVEAVMEGGVIRGIITQSKSGRQAILAKRVIDATGDADIACCAGAPYQIAQKQDLPGVTVTFSCSGVHKERFCEYARTHPISSCRLCKLIQN